MSATKRIGHGIDAQVAGDDVRLTVHDGTGGATTLTLDPKAQAKLLALLTRAVQAVDR